MTVLLQVRFEGELLLIEQVRENKFVVALREDHILSLLDEEDRSTHLPNVASSFEQALGQAGGWEQGVPEWVEPSVADVVSAALIRGEGRTSSAWQKWLRTGKTQGEKPFGL